MPYEQHVITADVEDNARVVLQMARSYQRQVKLHKNDMEHNKCIDLLEQIHAFTKSMVMYHQDFTSSNNI